MKAGTLIYFMKPVGLDGPIKIGCSIAPATRLQSLGTWSPFPLEVIGSVPGTIKDEGFLHRCFADSHSHHEWFRSSPELRAAIAIMLASGSMDVIRATHSPKGSIRTLPQRARTPEQRRHFSYSARINWAEKRLRKATGDSGAWRAPDDVNAIMEKYYRSRVLTPADAARLDEYLANPAAHSVLPKWLRPVAKPASAAAGAAA
jgi:hypothetical protein